MQSDLKSDPSVRHMWRACPCWMRFVSSYISTVFGCSVVRLCSSCHWAGFACFPFWSTGAEMRYWWYGMIWAHCLKLYICHWSLKRHTSSMYVGYYSMPFHVFFPFVLLITLLKLCNFQKWAVESAVFHCTHLFCQENPQQTFQVLRTTLHFSMICSNTRGASTPVWKLKQIYKRQHGQFEWKRTETQQRAVLLLA